MTKKQRAQVVELLRCAADAGSLMVIGAAPYRGDIAWMAWEAKRAVNADASLPYGYRWGHPTHRWRLLEAAARVEEGSWPIDATQRKPRGA